MAAARANSAAQRARGKHAYGKNKQRRHGVAAAGHIQLASAGRRTRRHQHHDVKAAQAAK
jgi:hypothetical protein